MTQALTFALNEQTGKYQATATVNSDFNLHIVCESVQFIDVLQKTAGTTYGRVCEAVTSVMDEDFVNVIYPKSIMVVCSGNPTEASITVND